MQAWEYKVIFIKQDEGFAAVQWSANKAGGEGWEAVGVVPPSAASHPNSFRLLFKRPKAQQREAI